MNANSRVAPLVSPSAPALLLLVLAVACSAGALPAADEPRLDKQLEPFRPFLGKMWRGEFKGSKPGQTTIDIARWERALNGTAIRTLHSINDGA